MPRLNGITILRFVAALWVLLFHLENRAPLPVGPGATNFLLNGAFAMVLFFVLSGTVLAYGYHRLQATPDDIRRFYLARLARIYPAYLAVHLLALWWSPLTETTDPVNWLYINALSALGLQGWFPQAIDFGINGGTWSLSVEFFFYALFPALLPLVGWLTRTHGSARVFFYLSALIGFLGFADFAFGHANTLGYYFLPILRVPEFMLGLVVGLDLVQAPAATGRPRLHLLAATACVVAGALYPIRETGLWMRANFFMVPALAWLIHACARVEQQFRPDWRGRFARSLIYLGEVSYGLFLFQLLVFSMLNTMGGRRWVLAQTAAHSVAWVWAGTIALALAGGIALHELVEKPAQRALLRRGRRRAAVAPLRS